MTCHVAGGIAPFALDTPAGGGVAGAAPSRRSPARARCRPGRRARCRRRCSTIAASPTRRSRCSRRGPTAARRWATPRTRRRPGSPTWSDIGVADFTVDMGVDYMPDTSLTDDYHCFLIDLQRQDDRMIVGYRITPGNGRTVHHVITSLFAASDRAALEALDAAVARARPGGRAWADRSRRTAPPRPDGSLGAWVPGVSSVLMPAGTATALHAGDLAVDAGSLQPAGGARPRPHEDRGEAGAGRDRGVAAAARDLAPGAPPARPAGESGRHRAGDRAARRTSGRRGSSTRTARPALVAVAGHMHLLGTHITLERTNAAGKTTLLDIPAWDFHWQGSYQLATPIAICTPTTSSHSLRLRQHRGAPRRGGLRRPDRRRPLGRGHAGRDVHRVRDRRRPGALALPFSRRW